MMPDRAAAYSKTVLLLLLHSVHLAVRAAFIAGASVHVSMAAACAVAVLAGCDVTNPHIGEERGGLNCEPACWLMCTDVWACWYAAAPL